MNDTQKTLLAFIALTIALAVWSILTVAYVRQAIPFFFPVIAATNVVTATISALTTKDS